MHPERRQHHRCRRQYLHCHQFHHRHYQSVLMHLMGTRHSSRMYRHCRHQYLGCHRIRRRQCLLAR